MNPNWTDFEKYVFSALGSQAEQIVRLREEIASLKGRAATWGAIAGMIATVTGEMILKAFIR